MTSGRHLIPALTSKASLLSRDRCAPAADIRDHPGDVLGVRLGKIFGEALMTDLKAAMRFLFRSLLEPRKRLKDETIAVGFEASAVLLEACHEAPQIGRGSLCCCGLLRRASHPLRTGACHDAV